MRQRIWQLNDATPPWGSYSIIVDQASACSATKLSLKDLARILGRLVPVAFPLNECECSAADMMPIPGRRGRPGAAGRAGQGGVFIDSLAGDVVDVMPIPGRRGRPGAAGRAGRAGVSIEGPAGDVVDVMPIPGRRGVQGPRGHPGTSIEGMPGADGNDGISGRPGRDGRNGRDGAAMMWEFSHGDESMSIVNPHERSVTIDSDTSFLATGFDLTAPTSYALIDASLSTTIVVGRNGSVRADVFVLVNMLSGGELGTIALSVDGGVTWQPVCVTSHNTLDIRDAFFPLFASVQLTGLTPGSVTIIVGWQSANSSELRILGASRPGTDFAYLQLTAIR